MKWSLKMRSLLTFSFVFDLNLFRHAFKNLRKQNVRKQRTSMMIQQETRQGKNECQPIALLSTSSGAYEAQLKASIIDRDPANKVRCQAA